MNGRFLVCGLWLVVCAGGCTSDKGPSPPAAQSSHASVPAPRGGLTDKDIDLAVYPGATEIDGSRVALHDDGVDKVSVSYQTPDGLAQVAEFYQAELGKLGTVQDKARGNPVLRSLSVDRADGTVSSMQATDGQQGGTLISIHRAFPRE